MRSKSPGEAKPRRCAAALHAAVARLRASAPHASAVRSIARAGGAAPASRPPGPRQSLQTGRTRVSDAQLWAGLGRAFRYAPICTGAFGCGSAVAWQRARAAFAWQPRGPQRARVV